MPKSAPAPVSAARAVGIYGPTEMSSAQLRDLLTDHFEASNALLSGELTPMVVPISPGRWNDTIADATSLAVEEEWPILGVTSPDTEEDEDLELWVEAASETFVARKSFIQRFISVLSGQNGVLFMLWDGQESDDDDNDDTFAMFDAACEADIPVFSLPLGLADMTAEESDEDTDEVDSADDDELDDDELQIDEDNEDSDEDNEENNVSAVSDDEITVDYLTELSKEDLYALGAEYEVVPGRGVSTTTFINRILEAVGSEERIDNRPGTKASAKAAKVAPAPAKRGPGRPKKVVEPEVDEEDEEEVDEAPVKRGPGRPRKTEAAAAPSAAKRGPGRPPKATSAPAAKPATVSANGTSPTALAIETIGNALLELAASLS